MFSRLFHRIPIVLLVGSASALGWTATVVREFEKPGAQPVAAPVRHSNGLHYAVTTAGGAHDAGTLLQLSGGSVRILHHFAGDDGAAPASTPVEAADGTLYGSTSSGGSGHFGTVFRYTPESGTMAVLVHFTGTTGTHPGSVPDAMTLHSDGNLYGVTRAGGSNGFGTVFKLSGTGQLTTLHHFDGITGSEPTGMLTFANGSFYGVCRSGGTSGFGTVFRISPAGTFTSLFSFTGVAGTRPGAGPSAGLRLHSGGQLFGTTEYGGSSGFGTAFRITTTATPVFTPLHHFTDPTGSQPAARLIEGNDGLLYGTCSTGGANGIGNLFRLTSSGTYTPLHDFSGIDGASPLSGLMAEDDGVLHGLTSAGGPGGLGVAYSLTSGGLFSITGGLTLPSGYLPSGSPLADEAGNFHFPLARGGTAGNGAIASYVPASNTMSFHPIDADVGDVPDGALTHFNGVFYGLCARGGTTDRGTAFTYDPVSGASPLSELTSSMGILPEGPFTPTSTALLGLAREGGPSLRGTVFRLTPAGSITRIFSFTGTTGSVPGKDPRGPLVAAPNLSYYGVTAHGGSSNTGVIYRINSLGAYSQIDSFGTSGPREPDGGLVLAADGFIYGSCRRGGSHDAGALIRIDPATDAWVTTASFDPSTASAPVGDLIATADGAVFGLTASGHAFRFHPAAGIEIIADFGHPATSPDEFGLQHTGGLASMGDGSLLAVLPAGGGGGGGQVVRIAPDSPLAAWKASELGDANAPDLGDPDHDLLPNLIEYALLTNPTSPDPPLTASLVNGRLELTLPRDPSRSDVAVMVETSGDLSGPWEILAISDHGLAFAGAGGISGDDSSSGVKSVVIRDLLATPAETHRFLRLRVEP